jgi:integrase
MNFTKAAIEALPSPPKGGRSYYYDTRQRGLGIRVNGGGAKTFIVYRWVNGKPERITLGRYLDLTIEQARGAAAEANAAIARGENPNDKRRAGRAELTFGELFHEYMERHAKIHKRSWKEDQGQYDRYLFAWAKRKLSHITRTDVQRLHHAIGNSKGHYAANRLLALLSSVFNQAKNLGLWEKASPATGIKKFRETSRDRFIQEDEFPRFFAALDEEPNETIRDYVLVSLLTGARRSNVLAMNWENIHLERAEWRIPMTKNGTSQVVPLSPEVVTILNQRRSQVESEWVFPGGGADGHLVEPRKGWERILDRAGITDLRLHDLRRTLGSWQARGGASLAIIGKSLNHKTPAATAIYARLDLDPVRQSVNAANTAILTAAGVKLPPGGHDSEEGSS